MSGGDAFFLPLPPSGTGMVSDVRVSFALSGVYPAGTQIIVQGGTNVVTLSASQASIIFPSPFPNGLIAVLASNGDTGATTAHVQGTSGATLSGFSMRWSITDGGVRVNWLAIGW